MSFFALRGGAAYGLAGAGSWSREPPPPRAAVATVLAAAAVAEAA